MRKSIVRTAAPPDAERFPTIHALSGPDAEGRIAYVEDHFFANESERKHQLKTILVDGTADAQVFERAGSAMWAATPAGRGEIGAHLALAPSGGRVAFLSGLTPRQMPGLLLHTGSIEVWDVTGKVLLTTATPAVDQPMSWFPDGKRLLFVRLVPRGELPQPAAGLDRFGGFVSAWDAVPAVHQLDMETGHVSFLQVGWLPVVAFDGEAVLIGGWTSRSEMAWSQVDPEKREGRPVRWPGDAQGAFAAPAEDLVLYWGWPTAGAEIRYTTYGSPAGGRQPMLTIKVARIDSAEFQTVISHLDPRARVSFGRVSN